MTSNTKRQRARQKHLQQKRRSRYMKVIDKYPRPRRTYDIETTSRGMTYNYEVNADSFEAMLLELSTLHIKVLQQLLNDASKMYLNGWPGDYHRRIIDMANGAILERTMLKE